MSETQTDTHARALAINLDGSIYGTFAEIGAGQEVARWFLTVGAASGTVAKSISAYDKQFSDKTYGAGTRYVSRDRLRAMLAHEYSLVLERLGASRGDRTRFFSFADTVATRNYKGDNEQHGWMGVRFQAEPHDELSQILLHFNLRDLTASLQQAAVGILGVNLLYAIHRTRRSADDFLDCLWDGLTMDRIEIDVIDFSGNAFAGQDLRPWALQLLRRKMTRAIAFDPAFHLIEPSGLLHKHPLIVDRGRFETLQPFHKAMLKSAHAALKSEGVELHREPLCILEMSLRPATHEDVPDDQTLLARIKAMLDLAPSLVTDLAEGYRLIPYLRRYTSEPIRMVGGVSLLARTLQSQYYHALSGSLLEGIGKLFASNVKFYAYPMPRDEVVRAIGPDSPENRVHIAESGKAIVGADDLNFSPPLNHLYRYLREAGQIIPIAPA